jgi:hypothetical protein
MKAEGKRQKNSFHFSLLTSHFSLLTFGLFSCKLPFLATPAQTGSYGIFTLEKLQDFYNIPQEAPCVSAGRYLSLPRAKNG